MTNCCFKKWGIPLFWTNPSRVSSDLDCTNTAITTATAAIPPITMNTNTIAIITTTFITATGISTAIIPI